MAPDICGGLRNCSPSSKSKSFLKKGPWTTVEDALLIEYVKMHGEGNWNAVQKHSGLLRCGKSCRLRWANHLRPDLKKGAFSTDEEKIIVDLHSKLGNKWARMAAQLPGRTDNEIKNYWNTRLKRRQRQGLPLYPHESVIGEQLKKQHDPTRTQNPNPFTFAPSMMGGPQESATPYLSLYRDNSGGLALALDSSNSFVSSLGQSFFSQGMVNQVNSYGVPEMGLSVAQAGLTPTGSTNEFVASSDGGDDYEVERGHKGSGLLEDLFGESPGLVCSAKLEEPYFVAPLNVHENGYEHGIANSDDSYEGLQAEASGDSNNVVMADDDLMNLLDNFPLAVPIPEWNGGNGSEKPILTRGTTGAIGSQQNASGYNSVASFTGAANQEWSFGASPCLWNNMPSIY